MRWTLWKWTFALMSLMVGLNVINPLGVPSLDPRLRYLGMAAFFVPANSMNPTLKAGDTVVVSAWPYRFGEPQRGDVAVFGYPPEPDIKYVKRLVGLPGERIAIRDGKVYINAQALTEPYVLQDPRGVLPHSDMPERLVAEGEFFVLGDNRNHSRDSRFWGAVPRQNLVGSVVKVFESGD